MHWAIQRIFRFHAWTIHESNTFNVVTILKCRLEQLLVLKAPWVGWMSRVDKWGGDIEILGHFDLLKNSAKRAELMKSWKKKYILKKISLNRPLALAVVWAIIVITCNYFEFESIYISTKDESGNFLMSNKGFCRTALATPGLLNTNASFLNVVLKKNQSQGKYFFF